MDPSRQSRGGFKIIMLKVKEKKERALGVKLFLKAERCNSPKCAFVRRPYYPGVHGQRRRSAPSDFSRQFQEKQKIRFSYGVNESQMKRIFSRAAKNPGITSQMIISFLERRLDNVIYRGGLAPSRFVARQFVSHGHFLVNGRRLTIASYEVKVGDLITIRPQSQNHPSFQEFDLVLKKYEPPVWLSLDKEKHELKVIALPKDLDLPFNANLVIDYYSKMV